MAFPVNGQTSRPRVYFSVANSKKNPFSADAETSSTSVVRIKVYVTEDGALCAEGPAFMVAGKNVIFSKAIRAGVQEETLIIKNSSV